MSNLFIIPSVTDGEIEGMTLTSELKANKYTVSYNCNNVGTNAFFMLYGTNAEGEDISYFLPIQFAGTVKFYLEIESDTDYLELNAKLNGAEITDFIISTVDDPVLEYVKENAGYWDRIKEVTSNTGKLRTDMLEGLIDMTVNAFSNESGTITQENGVLTFLDGDTVDSSTQAVQLTGGAIRVANSKLANGDWNWTTAISGAGINAATIIADTFSALDITGVTITSGKITGGTINGVNISGSTIIAGDTSEDGAYLEINKSGDIFGYCKGKKTVIINKASEGRMYIGEDLDSYDSAQLTLQTFYGHDGTNTSIVKASGQEGLALAQQGGSTIIVGTSGVQVYTPNRSGTVYIEGNVECTGYMRPAGGIV